MIYCIIFGIFFYVKTNTLTDFQICIKKISDNKIAGKTLAKQSKNSKFKVLKNKMVTSEHKVKVNIGFS